MRVYEMKVADFKELCRQRQSATADKYKDSHKKRDLAKDIIEELSDIYNITKLHAQEDKYKTVIDELENIIYIKVWELFETITSLDKSFKMYNVSVDDSKGGKRIYFDKQIDVAKE